MKRNAVRTSTLVMAAIALMQSTAGAQANKPRLHVNPRWDECSFQLDPSLTQAAWRQFTQEAGLVAYFRPVSDARPMGKGNFEVSMLQWQTGISSTDAAWNDTFVHPDSAHWLFEGSGLQFPGFQLRAGVSKSTDLGIYVTKNPGANYGFYGAQVQQSLVNNLATGWAAAARLSFISLYGPEDLDFTVYGADLVGSRTFALTRWMSVSPYVGVSTYLNRSHEKSAVVTLNDESVFGAQASVGAAMQLSLARIGVEYNAAKVQSISLKVGLGR